MKATIYNREGKEAGSTEIPEEIFGVKWNSDLVHQVVVSMDSNARTPVAHTRGRSDVRGGGKKPWRQKGTGRARHGSRRSPLWIGGGVTHGPTNERVYQKKINKKMRAKALACVLSRKYKEGEVLFVETLDINEPKTRTAREALEAWGSIKGFEKISQKKRNAAILSLGEGKEAVKKSFRNIGAITIEETRSLNPSSLLSATYVIIENPDTSLSALSERIK